MIKEELRKLRQLNATKEMIMKAKEDIGGISKYGRKYKNKYAYYIRAQHLGGYIKAALFYSEWLKNDIKTPIYEIYINVDGQEYITRVLDKSGNETRWSTARIDNLDTPDGPYYCNCEKIYWMDAHQAAYIAKTLNESSSGYYAIYNYQKKICEEKIKEKRKKETAPWDADMNLIPQEPKSWEKWWKKEGIPDNYIFYHYDRNITEGYCSYCEKNITLKEKPRHNKVSKCPVCHKEITYKSDGKIKTLNTGNCYIQLVQRISEGYVIRLYRAYKHYNNNWGALVSITNPGYSIYEIERILIRGNKTDIYDYEMYKQSELRWCKVYSSYNIAGTVYPYNLQYFIKNEWRQSCIGPMLKHKKEINIHKWLKEEKREPVLEKTVKVGAYRLAEQIMNAYYKYDLLNDKETELTKMLKLDKARLKRLVAADGGIKLLKWLQYEKIQNTIYDNYMLIELANENIMPDSLRFIIKRMSIVKIYNYLKRQQNISNDSLYQMLQTWEDYIKMAERAKLRTELEQIFKPNNLRQAHSEVIDMLAQEGYKKRAKEISKKYKNIDAICKSLIKYEFQDENYLIKAPKGISDIVREGERLKLCITWSDRYYERMEDRETFLLFLRRKKQPDNPWYLLEVEPSGAIRQKRTTGDDQKEDLKPAIPFLKKWQQEVQKRLTAEDMNLAKRSDKKRKEGYAKVREEKKLVWNGKLSGHLLADVLEADFMGIEETIEEVI